MHVSSTARSRPDVQLGDVRHGGTGLRRAKGRGIHAHPAALAGKGFQHLGQVPLIGGERCRGQLRDALTVAGLASRESRLAGCGNRRVGVQVHHHVRLRDRLEHGPGGIEAHPLGRAQRQLGQELVPPCVRQHDGSLSDGGQHDAPREGRIPRSLQIDPVLIPQIQIRGIRRLTPDQVPERGHMAGDIRRAPRGIAAGNSDRPPAPGPQGFRRDPGSSGLPRAVDSLNGDEQAPPERNGNYCACRRLRGRSPRRMRSSRRAGLAQVLPFLSSRLPWPRSSATGRRALAPGGQAR